MEEIKQSLERYAEHRIEPGGFLTAVLKNDLAGALGRADDINKHRLYEIVKYIWNELPSECWGSPEKVEKWLSS